MSQVSQIEKTLRCVRKRKEDAERDIEALERSRTLMNGDQAPTPTPTPTRAPRGQGKLAAEMIKHIGKRTMAADEIADILVASGVQTTGKLSLHRLVSQTLSRSSDFVQVTRGQYRARRRRSMKA